MNRRVSSAAESARAISDPSPVFAQQIAFADGYDLPTAELGLPAQILSHDGSDPAATAKTPRFVSAGEDYVRQLARPAAAVGSDFKAFGGRPTLINSRKPYRRELAQSESGNKKSSGATDLEAANQAIANPLAQATLVIIENDTVFLDGDLSDDTEVANLTVFEPLIPLGIGEFAGRQWSLVNRPILPFAATAPVPVAGGGGGPVTGASSGISFDNETGFGDFTFFSLLTPVDDSPVKWGVGPIVRFPTATDDQLGAEKFSAGPAAVAVYSSKEFTFGMLNQNLFSYAGDDDRDDVAISTLQYFAFYNFTPSWGIGTAPIASIDWNADDSDDRFLLPVGLGVTHTFTIGDVPTRLLVEGQYYAVQRDSFGPEWNIRFALGMFFPPLFD